MSTHSVITTKPFYLMTTDILPDNGMYIYVMWEVEYGDSVVENITFKALVLACELDTIPRHDVIASGKSYYSGTEEFPSTTHYVRFLPDNVIQVKNDSNGAERVPSKSAYSRDELKVMMELEDILTEADDGTDGKDQTSESKSTESPCLLIRVRKT